jgi:hypothetical protein
MKSISVAEEEISGTGSDKKDATHDGQDLSSDRPCWSVPPNGGLVGDLVLTHMPSLMDNNALLRCGQPSNSSKIDISIAKTRGWIVGGGRLVVMVVCQVEVFPFSLVVANPVSRPAASPLSDGPLRASPWRDTRRKKSLSESLGCARASRSPSYVAVAGREDALEIFQLSGG